ncbi:MAG: NAD(P)-binding protein, partial [Pseudomonadota bacterium]
AKISDVATARHAVASGKLDMVGMTRAHIADPHIVAKIAAGEEHRIRPCVGATYCLDRIYEGRDALCIHNAATSREATTPHAIPRAPAPRRVVVVGAGPGGLEAARVSGERGHQVTVFEAAGEAGGQLRLLRRAKRRAELGGIVDWRLAELDRLGVEIRFNAYAEVEDVVALSPEVVVIAAGGLPQAPEVAEGGELAVSSWDVLSGDVKPGESVLVYDDNGAHPGMAAAEAALDAGAKLEIVSPERMFAPEMGGLNLVPYMRKFHAGGAALTTMTRLASLRRAGNRIEATLVSAYGDHEVGTRIVDQVVVEHGAAPLADLYFALKPLSANKGRVDYAALRAGRSQPRPAEGFQLFRIGDAVASRNVHAAIYDALRFCKDL